MKRKKFGLFIPVMGILASALFIILAFILSKGMNGILGTQASGGGPVDGLLSEAGRWTMETLGFSLFQGSMIAAGACSAALAPLCLSPCYGGRKSLAAGIAAAAGMGVQAVMLLANGFLYEDFYLTMSAQGAARLCNILLAAGALVAGLAAVAFCCLELRASSRMVLSRRFLLTVTAVTVLLASLAFAVLAGTALGKRLGSVSGYLVGFGISYLLLAVAQLTGCYVRTES